MISVHQNAMRKFAVEQRSGRLASARVIRLRDYLLIVASRLNPRPVNAKALTPP
jgi:hypothetical protein